MYMYRAANLAHENDLRLPIATESDPLTDHQLNSSQSILEILF